RDRIVDVRDRIVDVRDRIVDVRDRIVDVRDRIVDVRDRILDVRWLCCRVLRMCCPVRRLTCSAGRPSRPAPHLGGSAWTLLVRVGMRSGLPSTVRACLFDLDGVLTPTASVHSAAWKSMFDAWLEPRARAAGTRFVPFDAVADYERYVDGKSRADGARSFLASR